MGPGAQAAATAGSTVRALPVPGAAARVDFWAPLAYPLRLHADRFAAVFHIRIAMSPLRRQTLLVLLVSLAAATAHGQGFKFSQPDDADRAAQAAREDRIAYELSTPCRADLKGKKIMVVIGEQQANGYVNAQQQNYGPHFQAINAPPALARPAHLHARGNQGADRAGGDRRVLQEQPRPRAVRGQAAGRELRAARPHHVRGDDESDHRGQPGVASAWASR